MVYAIAFLPKHHREKYQAKWANAFRQHASGPEIPAAWKNEVTLRNLNQTEWVLAAIYHGACAPGPEGEFNAMVLLDSRGQISTYNTSPCAGPLADLAAFWAEIVPAKNLDELYHNQQAWIDTTN